MTTDLTPPADASATIALLLPLNGRLSEAGESLRDGFFAAYYQQPPARRPTVRVYEAAEDPAGAYRRAVAEGAGFVVGPLGKEAVTAVARVADGRVPTLALNILPDGLATPPRFYQYALAPEDEARQVAERLLADGRRSGAALVPSGDRGARVLAAFQGVYMAAGVSSVTSRTYAAGATDFSEQLASLLGFGDSQRRQQAIAAIVGRPLLFAPRRRDDLQFLFFAGQPVQGRLLRAQLKFSYAGDVPVYSTSDVYEPNADANLDLEGVAFVDMPWMISEDPEITALRATVAHLWPGNARRRGRLYAMGFDVWQLVTELRTAGGAPPQALNGLTGRLTVDGGGRVHRGLDCVIVDADGRLRPLPPPSANL